MEANSQVVSSFTTKFNPKDKDHVLWLKKVQGAVVNMTTTKCQLPNLINQNPMKIQFQASDIMNWVHIHFGLAMLYTKAVFEGQAWIPNQAWHSSNISPEKTILRTLHSALTGFYFIKDSER